VVAGVVPGVVADWRIRGAFLGVDALRGVSVVLIAVGTLSLLDCFARFALEGRGTPAPVAPTGHLVVSGQYRYVRNPMYVAVVTVILGQGLLFGSTRVLGYAAVVWCCFHAFVLAYEEPTLQSQFGEAYSRYQAGVRRWWPAVRPWDPARASAVEDSRRRRTRG
jgi:protein-S-isoprenylcysteine O-methyltransferase Ste14